MGPEKNPELFRTVAEDIIPIIDEEFMRRNLIAPTLAELSLLFDAKDNTPHPVIEPTLFARLYALSMVQRSRMGVSGFDPMSAFDFDGKVEAKAAPHHDEFVTSDCNNYRTRTIRFVMPNQRVDNNISIFGLNFYQPNMDDSVSAGPKTETTSSGIVMVDSRGSVTKKKKPISGETVVFAVHNKQTGDAKLYQVAVENPEVTAAQMNFSSNPIEFQNEMEAIVTLPDNRRVRVVQLQGELQSQAGEELHMCAEILKGTAEPDSVLSTRERAAAKATISGAMND